MGSKVFITGGSSGIGESLALQYAAPGIIMGLLSRDTNGQIKAVSQACREKGADVFTFVADVRDTTAMKKAAQDFVSRAGGIDIVINLPDDAPGTTTLDIARANIDGNYFGVINTVTPFLALMKRQRHGSFVIISSISSLRSTHNSGPYSASKAAVNMWAEGLRLQLRSFGVSITVLRVGFVDTEMTRGNPFWMPGLISADRAAAIIINKTTRKTRIAVLPWTSGGLWTVFSLMPGAVYDWLIDTVKQRNDRRASQGSGKPQSMH
jgi:NAD(P)-dependent dehydrogenase (short-subunit alcohol dehydrogenase family)